MCVIPKPRRIWRRQIVALGDQAIGVEADVSKIGDLQKLMDAAVAQFGRVDIMVNNAGIETRTSVLETSEAQYDKVLALTSRAHSSAPSLPPGR